MLIIIAISKTNGVQSQNKKFINEALITIRFKIINFIDINWLIYQVKTDQFVRR